MRGLGWLSGLLVGVALASPAVPGEGEAPAEATLQGEVVDLHCYLTRGARGPGHAACANACIGRGVTPGFVADDGRVFLLLAEKPFSAKETVAGMAGETVRLKGSIVERDGVRGFRLKSAERIPPSNPL